MFRWVAAALTALALLLPSFGSAEDPKSLVFLFQKQKDPTALRSEADQLAAAISARIGIPVSAQIPGDYAASVQALVSGTADVAYVDSVSFLLARKDGNASLLLAEERPDVGGVARTEYDSILVVRQDSPLQSIEDLKRAHATTQIVFTSPTSTSGYLFPFRRFVQEGILKEGGDPKQAFQQVAFAGSYGAALEQVVAGLGDVAAVSNYAFEGAAADTYLSAEKRSQLRVLARIPGVPTHVVVARSGLSSGLTTKIQEALLSIGGENPKLLKDIYGAARFVRTDPDSHVKATAAALASLGLTVNAFTSKNKS